MKTRRRELRDLIKKALNDTDGSSRVLYLAKQVWKAEKQMVENRECLTLLFDRGFFTDEEMMNHLNKCFELFLNKASEILGDDVCRAIYDFGAGDKLQMVQRPPLRESVE